MPAAKLVMLDRDGVINEDRVEFIRSPEDWRPLPGSLEAIARLHRAGFLVTVVTNQSGVGRGLFSETVLHSIHARMRAAVEAAGGALAGIYYCPHLPEALCECRKPQPGMLRRLARELGRDVRGAPLIGDRPADLLAAQAVGARPILVRTGSGEATLAALAGHTPIEVYEDLAAAAAALLEERDP
jgi:D-glycero-D-manno-heptose 1,7-bisphosphate phosphatase